MGPATGTLLPRVGRDPAKGALLPNTGLAAKGDPTTGVAMSGLATFPVLKAVPVPVAKEEFKLPSVSNVIWILSRFLPPEV